MIRLFGAPMSSSSRCRIMLEEIGVPYEMVLTNPREPSAEFRALNPGGKIPYLIDGKLELFESMAINQYLGAKYKPELIGHNIEEQALIDQWSYWTIANVHPDALKIFRHTQTLPADQRQPAQLEEAKKSCERFINQLEQALTGDWLVNNRYTVADLNVGTEIYWLSTLAPELFARSPKVNAHIARVTSRPAFERTLRSSS